MSNNEKNPEKFTEQSFTFRRMKSWQVVALVVVVVLLAILYFYTAA